MSQVSSLVGAFDLNSQSGVMSVLASIRASKLSGAEKNELRDLVFLYTNGGGDASVKIALEQKLSAHQIEPVSVKMSAPKGPVLEFGSYRPTPSFRNIVPTTPVSNTPTPAPAPGVPPVVNQSPAPLPQTAPVMPQATPVAMPVSVPSTPTPVQQVPVAPAASLPVQPPVTPAPAEPAPQMVPQASTPEAAYLERIRQIKTAVNSKVGNPVNLVDIDNAVGREYMNALLEAMKKLSSGAVSEMEPAMQRLESAFALVQVAIEKHQTAVPTKPAPATAPVPTPVPPAPTPAPAPVPPPQQPPVVQAPVPVRPAPMPASTPVPPAPSAPVISQSVPVPPAPTPTPTPAPVPKPVDQLPVRPAAPRPVVDVPPIPSVQPNPVPIQQPIPTPVPDAPKKPAPLPIIEMPVSDEKSGFESSSLASEKKILTPQDLPEASTLETGAEGDPLFTKEIDDGLQQLLSDWTLFKKSGLFGTGPKGMEHPLFKKIADLQVPLLLAGRFEGATQEIRQSITDYMNGWRYEQGIIYQPGESFEKYLRRVIKHILDLQKKRKQA